MSIHHFSVSDYFYRNKGSAWIWLALRVAVGWQWLSAGYGKAMNPAWAGDQAGMAITGFFNNALTKTTGAHPDVSGFYANFIQNIALPNAELFSYLITYGEIAVGLALILGIFTGVSAFFGATMSFNFMFAGTVSMNPYWALAQIFLILGWRVAGYLGLDRFLLPLLDRNKMLPAQQKRNRR